MTCIKQSPLQISPHDRTEFTVPNDENHRRGVPVSRFPLQESTKTSKNDKGVGVQKRGWSVRELSSELCRFFRRIPTISKSCVNEKKVFNPQKYFYRKGFYAINCQVCCDAHRRITWMSLGHRGAVPDGVAWKQSVIVMSRAENFDFCLFVNFGPLLQLILYVFGI